MDNKELEELAGLIGIAAYNAYGAVLVGDPAPVTEALYKRMQDVRVGDWVVEQTTILMTGNSGARHGHYRKAIDAVGKLLRITQEKVDFGDPSFVWNEAEEGRPHPTEKCFYIQTLDGREFRWTNASFISVPSEYPVPEHRVKLSGDHG